MLFIDEFQEIAGDRAPYGDPDALTKQMRAVLQDSNRVTCLFAGLTDLISGALSAPASRHISSKSPVESRVGMMTLNFGMA